MTLVDELGNPGQCYTTGSIKSSKSRFKVQNRRSDIVGREDDSKIKQSTKFTATVLKSEKGDVTARGDTVEIVITHPAKTHNGHNASSFPSPKVPI